MTVAPPSGFSHNQAMNRFLKVILLLIWFVMGILLVLIPWSEIWETNYFVFQYPSLGLFANNAYLRGAISGLGFMNVLFAIESFRRRTPPVASHS